MDYVNRQYMGTYNPRTSHEPNIIYQTILIPIISPYIWLRFFHTIPNKHHKNIYWNHSHKTSMWTCVYVQVWLPHPEPKICSIPQMHWFQCRKMLRNKNWLVVYLPLWKIWVRQWEGWHPIYEMEKKKSCVKPPTRKRFLQRKNTSQIFAMQIAAFPVQYTPLPCRGLQRAHRGFWTCWELPDATSIWNTHKTMIKAP